MKSPLWILNSTLVISIIALILYFFLSSHYIPPQPSIEIYEEPEAIETEAPKVNIKRIYEENDLFNTYKQPVLPEPIIESKREIEPIPLPPEEKPLTIPAEPIAQFLEPLNISLKGIIYTGNKDTTQAIIADTQTKEEKLYFVGDKFFDAYLLRIFKNGIIILRSNGQQETIYVSKAEAQKALEALQSVSWDSDIEKEGDRHYNIDPQELAKKIGSLARFIEMTDLTTVFKGGKSLGVRIGKLEEKSLGHALGLRSGDIITSIENIAPNSTKNRVEIYNNIKDKALGNTIAVELLRNQQPQKLEYLLQKINADKPPLLSPIVQQEDLKTTVTPKNLTRLQEKYALSPLTKSIKRYDKHTMLKYGSRNSTIKS